MRVAAVLLAVSLLGACASPRDTVATEGAGPSEPAPELPAVEPSLPAFHLTFRAPVDRKTVDAAERVKGVAVAAPLAIERVPVRVGDAHRSLRVVSVEPVSFRSVAPGQTRDAPFVWTALIGGRAVLTPEASRALNFGSSGTLGFPGRQLTVGAFADNAVPNLGDVMVSSGVARSVDLGAADEAIVGVEDGANLDAIEDALRDIAGVERLRRLQPRAAEPVPAPDPVGVAEGDLIGRMNFRILKNGFIDPDPAWVASNIVQGTVPILGEVTCHRIVFPQLAAALGEIQREGLAKKIDVSEYGGCYVPRFIGRDPRRGLSMHAFGLAIDLNVSANHLGTNGRMDPEVVEIFERWGFLWGGRWSPPDPMHFELARLIEV